MFVLSERFKFIIIYIGALEELVSIIKAELRCVDKSDTVLAIGRARFKAGRSHN